MKTRKRQVVAGLVDRWRHARELPPLANIEDPNQRLRVPSQRPAPACFAPIPLAWKERAESAERRAPWPRFPEEIDWTRYQIAPRPQQLAFLRGDEPFALAGMHRAHALLEGSLPGVAPRCFATRPGDRSGEIEMRLDTVVLDADAMKVITEGKSADGTPWSFEILYKNGKRATESTDGKVKTFPQSPEFYEPLLHYRSARALTSKLISMQVLPTWAANLPETTNTDGIMTLERYKGGVADVLGSTETKNTQAPPRVWIEQDSFVIRKVRLGSQVEVEFDNVKDYEDGKVKIPEQQSVFWKNATVLLQNKSVEFVDQGKLEPHLKLQKGAGAKLPAEVNIKEFYSRFR